MAKSHLPIRKIIHIDMDAYFASVEQRDNPELRGRPVVVGGRHQDRGVVAAASYEARQFGIHSAMPSATASRLCPQLVFVKGRINHYKEISQDIMAMFLDYSDLVEPLALDEAFIDVSDSKVCRGSATLIAQDIRHRIRSELNLTASAGVSYNKFFAKLACGRNKPNGLSVLLPQEAIALVQRLSVRDFFGIGKATETKLAQHNIYTGADIAATPLEQLVDILGKSAYFYHQLAQGIDNRPVRPSRQRKSVGSETTFSQDIKDDTLVLAKLSDCVDKAWYRLRRYDWLAFTVTIKVKFNTFQQITRAHTATLPFATPATVLAVVTSLYLSIENKTPKRLVGISFSNMTAQVDLPVQLSLFDTP